MSNPFLNVIPIYVDVRQTLQGVMLRRAKLTVSGLTPAVSAAWQASHAYSVGAQILDANGNVQQVSAAGTSGAAAPAWSKTVGASTTDGPVTWIDIGTNANAIPHGLPDTPLIVDLVPTSAGGFHRTQPADSANIYVTADGAGTSVELHVEY